MDQSAAFIRGAQGAQASQVAFSQYLPAAALTCAPEAACMHQELHWLAYVSPSGQPKLPMRVECELWRWHDGQWRSIFVPGSRFTPTELHEQGWRYCKPCEPLVAVVRS